MKNENKRSLKYFFFNTTKIHVESIIEYYQNF